MNFTAELYIGECIYRTFVIEKYVEQIIINGYAHPRISVFGPSPVAPIDLPKMIFGFKKQTGPNTLRFEFETATGRVNTFSRIEEFFEFPPDEPDENVNLDILKNKFRSGEKITELLLNFYKT